MRLPDRSLPLLDEHCLIFNSFTELQGEKQIHCLLIVFYLEIWKINQNNNRYLVWTLLLW